MNIPTVLALVLMILITVAAVVGTTPRSTPRG